MSSRVGLRRFALALSDGEAASVPGPLAPLVSTAGPEGAAGGGDARAGLRFEVSVSLPCGPVTNAEEAGGDSCEQHSGKETRLGGEACLRSHLRGPDDIGAMTAAHEICKTLSVDDLLAWAANDPSRATKPAAS